MSMFDQFETDSNLEQNGIYLDYGDFRVKIARAGGSNKRYLAYADTKTKPFRRAMQAGSFTEERARPLLYDIYASTIVLDWEVKNEDEQWVRGIHTKSGGVAEFNKDNVISTFNLLPEIFLDIQRAADSISLFRKEELEADAKNL